MRFSYIILAAFFISSSVLGDPCQDRLEKVAPFSPSSFLHDYELGLGSKIVFKQPMVVPPSGVVELRGVIKIGPDPREGGDGYAYSTYYNFQFPRSQTVQKLPENLELTVVGPAEGPIEFKKYAGDSHISKRTVWHLETPSGQPVELQIESQLDVHLTHVVENLHNVLDLYSNLTPIK